MTFSPHAVVAGTTISDGLHRACVRPAPPCYTRVFDMDVTEARAAWLNSGRAGPPIVPCGLQQLHAPMRVTASAALIPRT